MAYSTQEVTSDGTLVSLDLTIEYFDRSEIAVYFDGVVDDLPWAWVGTTENTIEFDPAVPDDVVVQIRRTTDLSEARHIFTEGAAFTTESVDEDILQILHIAQEAREGSGLGDIFQDLNAHGYKIINVGDPVDDGDAMNKGSAAAVINALIADELADIAVSVAAADSSADAAAVSAAAADASADAAAASAESVAGSFREFDFRLSLTTGVPVTTSDVTGATTLYCVPYTGNRLSLYNGATWDTLTSAEFSIALGTLTSDLPYDAFVYNNAGVPALELLPWASATARATALAYQDGTLVKSGTATRRYAGTLCTTSTTTTEDSLSSRYLQNYYNRCDRPMKKTDPADSWSHTSAWRQANGNSANQLNFVIGFVEDAVQATSSAYVTNSAGGVSFAAGIGLNSTGTNHAQIFGGASTSANTVGTAQAHFVGVPALGKNYLAWLEASAVTGTTTFYGDAAGVLLQTGIVGMMRG